MFLNVDIRFLIFFSSTEICNTFEIITGFKFFVSPPWNMFNFMWTVIVNRIIPFFCIAQSKKSIPPSLLAWRRLQEIVRNLLYEGWTENVRVPTISNRFRHVQWFICYCVIDLVILFDLFKMGLKSYILERIA